jgi:hypothetical protein
MAAETDRDASAGHAPLRIRAGWRAFRYELTFPRNRRRPVVSEAETSQVEEIRVDGSNLYREEIFTDLKVATIRRLTPVKPDGSDDASRPVVYVGQTTLLSQAGPVPVQCQIEAGSLQEAMDGFPGAVNQAVERMIDEAREMQRQEASRIVVPGRDSGPGKINLG